MKVKDTQRHSFLCEWIGIFEKIEYLCNALAFRVGHERKLLFLSWQEMIEQREQNDACINYVEL